MDISWYLALSAVLFTIGVLGVLLRRNAVNLTLVALSQSMGDVTGQVLVFFSMSVAAAEAAIGLAIIIALFRRKLTLDVTQIHLFRY